MYKGEILVKKSNGAINVNSGFLERTFKLSQSNTTIKTEIIAGITTFLTMAYIIAVNPDFLSQTGMEKGAVLTATCLTAVFLEGIVFIILLLTKVREIVVNSIPTFLKIAVSAAMIISVLLTFLFVDFLIQ
ncbi:putative membrane protein [Clostridium botulinum 202F]|nr:putative membrane protein [Clostridium botulinum 202F]